MPYSRALAKVLNFSNLAECRGDVELFSTVVKVIERECTRLNSFRDQDSSFYANDIV